MNIYVICAVRNSTPEQVDRIRDYANAMKWDHHVHFPPDDVPQNCETGVSICEAHRKAMIEADEVHVFWDVDSSGSHFDLGMAYALRKKIVPVECVYPDRPGKSYWKVMNHVDREGRV